VHLLARLYIQREWEYFFPPDAATERNLEALRGRDELWLDKRGLPIL
jgi:hypothetical protein